MKISRVVWLAGVSECLNLSSAEPVAFPNIDEALFLFWLSSFLFLFVSTLILYFVRAPAKWRDLDTGHCVMRYTGVSKSWFGYITRGMWMAYCIVGYMQMILFILSHYDIFQFVGPPIGWTQMAYTYAWLLVSVLSVTMVYGSYTDFLEELFTRPADFEECEKVVVKGDDRNTFMLDVWRNANEARCFECCCLRFSWCDKQQRFRTYMTEHVTAKAANDALQRGGLSKSQAFQAKQTVGANRINVYVPTKVEVLTSAFLAPTFLFQFATVMLHMFYSTWNLGSAIFCVAITLTIHRALAVRRNQVKLDQVANFRSTATVLRQKLVDINADEIVPGDIILIDEGATVPCDCMVISGSVVVNESAVTGEPMPIAKIPGNLDFPQILTPEDHSKHFLYMGTHVMQSTEGPFDGRVAALVISIGGLTFKGQLLRTVLFPASFDFKFNTHFKYAVWILFAVGVGCFAGSALELNETNWIAGFFSGLYAIVCALDPNIPNAILVSQNGTSSWLETFGIRCLVPEAIPVAGKITACVFDKTGTITKDGVDFMAIHSMIGDQFGDFISMESNCWRKKVNELTQQALGVCHTVTKLEKGDELVGNHVEVSMVKASGWSIMSRSNAMVYPPAEMSCGSLEIVRQLQFNHERMTSGCIVRNEEGNYLVFVKGAYENIAAISKVVPANYTEITEKYAGEQYYVLGMGVKELPAGAPIGSMTLDELEHDITLLGLLLFRNEVKEDSAAALHSLRKGNIRCVVCTGDNALTGAEVARNVGLFQDGMDQVLVDIVEDRLVFQSRSGQQIAEPKDYSKVETTMTAPAFRHLCDSGQIHSIMPTARVFARMKPHDKVKVVQLFQEMGCVTAMVGDGGNDCGALRMANVGLAFSSAEASLVSPFSTSGDSLWAVEEMIRGGRACLATQMSTTMWFVCYGLLCGPSFWYLLRMCTNMTTTEVQYIVQSIFLPMGIAVIMTSCKPCKTLSKIRPSAALLGVRGILNIVSIFLFFVIASAIAFTVLESDEEFVKGSDIIKFGYPAEMWVLRGDCYQSATLWLIFMTQLIISAFSFSIGAEHRESVFANKKLMIACSLFITLFVTLIWGENQLVHTLFRINCSNAASFGNAAPWISWFSTGPIGGCFLGPQMHLIYEQQMKEGIPWTKPTPENGCTTRPDATEPADLHNIFSSQFRVYLSLILLGMSACSIGFHYALTRFHPKQKAYFKKL